MLLSIYTGRSGMVAQQEKMTTLSNNIANSNTNSYKKVDVSFSENLGQITNQRNGLPFTSENPIFQGGGVRASNIFRNFNEGPFIQTGIDTDISIAGEGYFKVINANGEEFYTRDGSFNIDVNGNFVHSASGMKLEVEGFKPQYVKQPVLISKDGTISYEENIIGKVNVYDFAYKNSMISKGDNVFTAGDRPIDTNGEVVQGYIEGSNVNMVDELTNMITVQRSYEFNSRSIKSADEMWQLANNLKK